jgi:hypothetical protein
MAGRGRAATLPAWMTQGTVPGASVATAPAPAPAAQAPPQSSGGLGGSLGASFAPAQPTVAPGAAPTHQTTSTQQPGYHTCLRNVYRGSCFSADLMLPCRRITIGNSVEAAPSGPRKSLWSEHVAEDGRKYYYNAVSGGFCVQVGVSFDSRIASRAVLAA